MIYISFRLHLDQFKPVIILDVFSFTTALNIQSLQGLGHNNYIGLCNCLRIHYVIHIH